VPAPCFLAQTHSSSLPPCRPGLGGLPGATNSQAAALGVQQRLSGGGGLTPNLQQLGLGQAQAGRLGVPGQQFTGVNGEEGSRRGRRDWGVRKAAGPKGWPAA
jgi:hypothetical protein